VQTHIIALDDASLSMEYIKRKDDNKILDFHYLIYDGSHTYTSKEHGAIGPCTQSQLGTTTCSYIRPHTRDYSCPTNLFLSNTQVTCPKAEATKVLSSPMSLCRDGSKDLVLGNPWPITVAVHCPSVVPQIIEIQEAGNYLLNQGLHCIVMDSETGQLIWQPSTSSGITLSPHNGNKADSAISPLPFNIGQLDTQPVMRNIWFWATLALGSSAIFMVICCLICKFCPSACSPCLPPFLQKLISSSATATKTSSNQTVTVNNTNSQNGQERTPFIQVFNPNGNNELSTPDRLFTRLRALDDRIDNRLHALAQEGRNRWRDDEGQGMEVHSLSQLPSDGTNTRITLL